MLTSRPIIFKRSVQRLSSSFTPYQPLYLTPPVYTIAGDWRRPIVPTRAFATAAMVSTVSDVLKHDHRELEEYYNSILSEELVVYPAMEKYLQNGKQMADKDRQEHQEAKELLYKFQQLTPDNAEFESTLKKLMSELKDHIKGEEEDDLPQLEKALPTGESSDLAANFQRTKKFVPTRSHPSAPDKPPFETVAGLLAAPMDKLGDLFRRFPKE
ncbi:hypothetical protein IAU59_006946 [Kwoniella sp. CBS 9459]